MCKYEASTGNVLIAHMKDREIRTFYKAYADKADPLQAAIETAKRLVK